jgi:hypothetical protein
MQTAKTRWAALMDASNLTVKAVIGWMDQRNPSEWPLEEAPPTTGNDIVLLQVALCLNPHKWM